MAGNPGESRRNLKRKRSNEGLFQSRIITFVVGPMATEFHIHQNALVDLSSPIRVLLTGPMKESIDARVVWDDIDPSTFLDFIEFAYTKNYKSKRFKTEMIKQAPKNLAGWQAYPGSSINVAASVTEHRNNFVKGLPKKLKIYSTRNSDEIIYNDDATHDAEIRDLFERHINLYILVDRYEVQSLLDLVLTKIHHNLIYASRSPALARTTCTMIPLSWNNTLEEDASRKMWLNWIMTDPEFLTGKPPSANTVGYSEGFKNALEVSGFAKQYALCIPYDFWKDLCDA